MLKSEAEDFRHKLKTITEELGRHRSSLSNEINANIELTYRHLEDASMRLGKAIQAIDGGISVYDKTQVAESTDAGHAN